MTTHDSQSKLALTKSLGQRIRELRNQKDLSTRGLAKKAQISSAFLSDIELGRRHPSEKVLTSIATTLETTLEELQEYDARPTIEEFKRRISKIPALAFAFRRILDENVSPQELVDLADNKAKHTTK